MGGMAGGCVQEQNVTMVNKHHTRNATPVLSTGAHHSCILTPSARRSGQVPPSPCPVEYWKMWIRAAANRRVTPASAKHLMQSSILRSCCLTPGSSIHLIKGGYFTAELLTLDLLNIQWRRIGTSGAWFHLTLQLVHKSKSNSLILQVLAMDCANRRIKKHFARCSVLCSVLCRPCLLWM